MPADPVAGEFVGQRRARVRLRRLGQRRQADFVGGGVGAHRFSLTDRDSSDSTLGCIKMISLSFSAPAPAEMPPGMPPGSPFGPNLVALILHLHVTQAIGFERLVRLLDEVFAIRISEGAIANMLARAGAPLTTAAETTAAAVRSSAVVASDETSARV